MYVGASVCELQYLSMGESGGVRYFNGGCRTYLYRWPSLVAAGQLLLINLCLVWLCYICLVLTTVLCFVPMYHTVGVGKLPVCYPTHVESTDTEP